MRRFIFKLFVFLLPLLFIASWLEINLRPMPNSFSLKKIYLEQKLDDVEIVTTGSSYGTAINPAFFDHPGFNLAGPSQDLYYDYHLVRYYLSKLKNLKLIIVPVSYFSFRESMGQSSDSWRQFFYHSVWDIPFEANVTPFDVRQYSYLMLYGLPYAWEFAQKGFSGETGGTDTGWWGTNLLGTQESAINDRKGAERASGHSIVMKMAAIARNTEILRKLVTGAQARNIGVVLITVPAFRTYWEHFDPAQDEEMRTIVQSLITQYHLQYFDYLRDQRFTIDDFADSDHLNPQGAEKFTRILNRDVIQPFYRNMKP